MAEETNNPDFETDLLNGNQSIRNPIQKSGRRTTKRNIKVPSAGGYDEKDTHPTPSPGTMDKSSLSSEDYLDLTKNLHNKTSNKLIEEEIDLPRKSNQDAFKGNDKGEQYQPLQNPDMGASVRKAEEGNAVPLHTHEKSSKEKKFPTWIWIVLGSAFILVLLVDLSAFVFSFSGKDFNSTINVQPSEMNPINNYANNYTIIIQLNDELIKSLTNQTLTEIQRYLNLTNQTNSS